jgi:NADH:ubiquinone oxidoreductase subunit 4 (subunit M)
VTAESVKKLLDVPNYMKLAMGILVVLVVVLGVYPTFFMNLINTVSFG